MKAKPSKKASSQFVIVWEFRTRPDKRGEFEEAYALGGIWGQFFRQAKGYLGTELLQDRDNPLRYFTVDVWTSRQAYRQFQHHNSDGYHALDAKCELLTESEAKIGEFDSASSALEAVRGRTESIIPSITPTKVPGIQVRPAVITDIPRMTAIERSAHSAAHWSKSAYREMFQPDVAPRIALVLVQEKPEYLAGFVIARIANGECELENIVVDDRLQRRGLGKRLIKSLVGAVRNRNARRIFLEVRESNAAARGLYEKCGFTVTGWRDSYYRDPLEDAILYTLEM